MKLAAKQSKVWSTGYAIGHIYTCTLSLRFCLIVQTRKWLAVNLKHRKATPVLSNMYENTVIVEASPGDASNLRMTK